jgi:CubicO group peptidase (beta-lactamase class C family)
LLTDVNETAIIADRVFGLLSVVQRGPIDPADLEVFLDDFFDKNMEELDIPGAAVVVVQDGEILFTKGYVYVVEINETFQASK